MHNQSRFPRQRMAGEPRTGAAIEPARVVSSEEMHGASAVTATPPPRVVPFARPDIDDDDVAAVVEALQSEWLTTGPNVSKFESQFAETLGSTHAIALNSATAALHLALDAIGLSAGDEVIIPTITFTASAEVTRYFDAVPVLVDVEADTLCVNPDEIERAITPRTRAIMPVHVGGHPARMDRVMDIARRHELYVIEDAAHSFPCTLDGRNAGTIGHLGAFSFYATKTITTGEGGMLVTNVDGFAERARCMSLHGMSRDAWKRYAGGSWRYDVIAPGYKYNLTDLAAALGLSQLRKATRMWEDRRRIASAYSAAFSAMPELQIPIELDGSRHSWHLYILRLNAERLRINRDEFLEALAELGVVTSVHFIPVHTFTYYRNTYSYHDERFPVAMHEFARMFSLPIYPAMTDRDVEQVIASVRQVVARNRL